MMTMTLAPLEPPGAIMQALMPALEALDAVLRLPPFSWLLPAPGEGETLVTILANPLLMDWLGIAIIGEPPGRYATLDPLCMAAWAGCFLTAMNLLPIGQLDGGHIANGLAPQWARPLARVGLFVLVLGGLLWPGWLIWGLLLYKLGATRSIEVPDQPEPTARAKWTAVGCAVAFVVCFMPAPVQIDVVSTDDIRWLDPAGHELSPKEAAAWLQAQAD
jgi:hypothetical protein